MTTERATGRRVSVKEVAAAAGVSVGTVSNVLNRPDKVSPATRERIQTVIDELGFVRNDAARQLRAGSNRAVAMIVLDVANPFFTDVAHSVEDQLAAEARPLILANSAQDARREASYLDLFEEQRVEGMLLTPVGDVLTRLHQLRERGVAVVLVDRIIDSADFSSVSVDDHLGGTLAARHLLDAGRRHLAFIGGPAHLTQVRDRWAATQEAVAGVTGATAELVETDAMEATAGRRAVEALWERPADQRPDAVFAANDLVALGVLQALTQLRVGVPDEVALIGYDDIDFAASAAVPLSSVRQPREQLGREAARILLEVMSAPSAPARHVVLEPELVVRESTVGRG
ncbi:LacI family transcriptional regulator [Nocardioides panacisoli]|uniref:LacI family DNA-binding transcriptional regulator n=1 Tax=Nocardioides panacisoli TaxID=627624 RepID=UPI001C62B8A3|nr:LacI family DNA-binding transcriptional regulator [Nocardioides panacisoli]QYJ03027.1 LacI family transcriptional regulator [Nocardioides panacisoli]